MSDFDTVAKSQTRITKKEKVLILFILVFLLSISILPVLQSAINWELTVNLKETEREITSLGERQRVLQAKLAQAQMPERILLAAELNGLVLQKISFDDIRIVHREVVK
jgi:cell division protein FtsL